MFSRIYIFQSNIAETIFQHRFRFRRQFRSLTKRTKTESLKTHNIPDVRADINIRACFWLLPGHNEERAYDKSFRNSKYVSLSRRFHGACGALSEQRNALVFELKQPEGKETVAPLSTAEPPESWFKLSVMDIVRGQWDSRVEEEAKLDRNKKGTHIKWRKKQESNTSMI